MFQSIRNPLKRCISTSATLLQQQSYGQQRPSFGQRFGNAPSSQPSQQQPQQPPMLEEPPSDESFDEVSPPRSSFRPQSNASYRPSSPPMSAQFSAPFEKPSPTAINPFPQEAEQDYSMATFTGASSSPFSPEIAAILHAELGAEDIEIKPDGALYLPESRYRKVLNKAFGPGGWCMIPRGPHTLHGGVLSREYALYCQGRFVSQARGHGAVQGFSNPAMASEGVKSNALMRACKDLGIGNELWDPAFTAQWKSTFARPVNQGGKTKWIKVNRP